MIKRYERVDRIHEEKRKEDTRITECDCAYCFVLQQRYPTVESDTGAGLHRNIGALAFEVRAPFVIVMMLMLVQGAVRVEDVI